MTPQNWISIGGIALGPIAAVTITLWNQRRSERRKVRMDLFLRLWRDRNKWPITPGFVDALNEIELVFYKNPRIIALWRSLHDELHQTGDINIEKYNAKLLDMLSEIALYLGYDLRQTVIGRPYLPRQFQAHWEQREAIGEELLRVLSHSAHFGVGRKPSSAKGTNANDTSNT